jgi:alpha-1,3-fucosyltransferase
MISNCHAESGRDVYIAQLQKYIPIHIYGRCGNFQCNRTLDCYSLLAKRYKFWLSFENSLCREYITEKFFEPLRQGNVVPIVWGLGPYTDVAPKGSYIDVRDFDSPRALANYIQHLDTHPAEYLKFFSWRQKFRVSSAEELYGSGFWCSVCQKLHETNVSDRQRRKWYSNLGNWFRKNNTNTSICTDPYTFLSSFISPKNM